MQNKPKSGKLRYSRRDRNVSFDTSTPEDKAKLRILADRSGLSLSDYMRAATTCELDAETIFAMEFRRVTTAA